MLREVNIDCYREINESAVLFLCLLLSSDKRPMFELIRELSYFCQSLELFEDIQIDFNISLKHSYLDNGRLHLYIIFSTPLC